MPTLTVSIFGAAKPLILKDCMREVPYFASKGKVSKSDPMALLAPNSPKPANPVDFKNSLLRFIVIIAFFGFALAI
jgi:hypothetical protein